MEDFTGSRGKSRFDFARFAFQHGLSNLRCLNRLRAATTILFLALWAWNVSATHAGYSASPQIGPSPGTIRSALSLHAEPVEIAPVPSSIFLHAELNQRSDDFRSSGAIRSAEFIQVAAGFYSVERPAALISSHLAEQASLYIRAP